MTPDQLPYYLSIGQLEELVDRFLSEDIGPGDVTTMATVPADRIVGARFEVRNEGVVAGIAAAETTLRRVDPLLEVQWQVCDGEKVRTGTLLGIAQGRVRSLLTAERVALNLLQRMSGIATVTARFVEAARPATILDTRKTAPGLRLLDKWAVLLGGGQNHRIGLFDMVLIKDNHISAAGGVEEALSAASDYLERRGESLPIEIETRTLEEVRAAMAVGGFDWILLDNMVVRQSDGSFDVSMLKEAVRIVDGRAQTEASGNVNEDSLGAIARTGVDAVSSGALTHSVRALDIAMKIEAP